MRRKTYALDDNLIIEGESGSELYFIQNGRISIFHKKTKTHIKDLLKDQYFGEISFFSTLPRQTSAKARDFTDVLTI